MRGPHNFWRLIRTGATFERTGAMRLALEAMEAPYSLRIAARVLGWPFQWLGLRGDPTMPPVPRALTALGPAYIKFGQIMSTRPDVVGDDLARQLQGVVFKDDPEDARKLASYIDLVARDRARKSPVWKDFYDAAKAALKEK